MEHSNCADYRDLGKNLQLFLNCLLYVCIIAVRWRLAFAVLGIIHRRMKPLTQVFRPPLSKLNKNSNSYFLFLICSKNISLQTPVLPLSVCKLWFFYSLSVKSSSLLLSSCKHQFSFSPSVNSSSPIFYL